MYLFGDDIIVEFNEDIVPGYVGDKNVIVTAKLNGQPATHDVAKQLRPGDDGQSTANPIFLTGDFSFDCWMKWTEAGSILRICNGHFAISVDEAGHIVLNIGKSQIASQDVMPKDEWTYLCMSFNASAKTISALGLYGSSNLPFFTDYFVGDELMQQIQYSEDNRLYLGNMNGAMHDLSLFNIYRDPVEAAATRNQEKDNYNYGLMNYWPMKEGHGTAASDMHGTAQQTVNGKPADLDNGRDITFRLWDATTGIIYSNVSITLPDGTAMETITFNPAVNYGSFDSPLIFTKSDLIEQPLYLRTGWNWLSLGVEPGDAQTCDVFKDFTSWQVRLKNHDSGMYYCNGSYWADPLDEVHANKMYKMMLTPIAGSKDMPQPLNVVGRQVKLADTPVTLEHDWNWMPYTPTVTMTIGEALAGANPQVGDQVKSQTAFAYYGPYGWEGNLLALESGKGYLYQSKDTLTKTFVYPTVATSSARRNAAAAATTPAVRAAGFTPAGSATTPAVRAAGFAPAGSLSAFSPVNPNAYPDNMTMVILLTNNGTSIADAEVAAFVDGECRGAAVATTNGELPLYYLLIAGEGSGQPMELRAYIGGSTMNVSTDLTYSSDGNIGTPWEPFVIDISGTVGITAVDGLPIDTHWYTLQGFYIGTTKPSVPGIYICRTSKDNRQGNSGKIVVIKRPGSKNK